MAEVESRLKADEQALQTVVQSLRPTRYGRLRYPEPMTVASARNVLPADAALLSYYVLPNQTVLFVVTKASFSQTPIPQTRVALEQKVSKLLSLLSQGATDESLNEFTPVSHDLYKTLLAPVANELKGVKRLIIAPDGPLCYLPFSALVTSGEKGTQRYLIDDHIVSTLPSLSAIEFGREGRGKWKAATSRVLTAFAEPDLSNFKLKVNSASDTPNREAGESLLPLSHGANEVASAAALFKGKDKVYLRLEANVTQALLPANASPLLLFSTPIRLGDDEPSAVGIALSKGAQSEDGFLGPEEIVNLKLNAELVVLSGGYAVPEKLTTGEGYVTLSRGLLYAGAKSVALSLWRVNAPSRVELTESLFANLKTQMAGGNLDKAAALRNAQLKLRQNKATVHPFHWGAFVLAGDWF
jgi:CHAT domain-containing protein